MKRTRRPLARLAGTIARLPRYLNLAQRLMRDPSVSPVRKAALGLGIGYVAMPLDLIPGIIPILGQLDDLAALLLGLRAALRGCTSDAAEEHLSRVGLSTSALDADVRTVQVASVWLVIETAKVGARVLTFPFRALGRARRTQTSAPPETGARPGTSPPNRNKTGPDKAPPAPDYPRRSFLESCVHWAADPGRDGRFLNVW